MNRRVFRGMCNVFQIIGLMLIIWNSFQPAPALCVFIFFCGLAGVLKSIGRKNPNLLEILDVFSGLALMGIYGAYFLLLSLFGR